MKFSRKDIEKFNPIIVEIENKEEAELLLAFFNRAPSVLSTALDSKFSEQDIMRIFGRTQNPHGQSVFEKLNTVLEEEDD